MLLRAVPPGVERNAYLPLLMLADDSEEQVRAYYQTGELFAYDDQVGNSLGMVLVTRNAADEVELKAVAVDAPLQGRGIGRQMVKAVLEELRRAGVRRVIVGTGNSGIGPLAFYQKVGFRLLCIERDFFGVARGYRSGIVENGIPLRDMVWMDLELCGTNL